MSFVCPNCTGKIEKDRPLDLYVFCEKCGNEWTIVPRFSKFEYIQMVKTEVEKSSKEELSQKIGVDIDEFLKNLLDYWLYTQDIYYKLCKIKGMTMQNIQEYLLIRPEDYEVYRRDYLKREESAKDLIS